MIKIKDHLIAKVHSKRLAEGLSLRSLGKKIGVSFSTLARLERGIGAPDQYTVERLIRWLEMDEGSPSKIRSLQEDSWAIRIERRLEVLERRVNGETE